MSVRAQLGNICGVSIIACFFCGARDSGVVRGRLSGVPCGGIHSGGLFGCGIGESGTSGRLGSTLGRVVIIPEGKVITRVVFSGVVVGVGLTRSNVLEEAEGEE